ncbi:unnamed protein product [Coregonus sp. 'balchen']|nr:unnamed protein product [Coregonus sp. 'balchen']
MVLVRWVVKAPLDSDMFQAATSGDCEWLHLSLKRSLLQRSKNSVPLGRRPIHMVLTAQSRRHSHACLTCLLEHGALPNVYVTLVHHLLL